MTGVLVLKFCALVVGLCAVILLLSEDARVR